MQHISILAIAAAAAVGSSVPAYAEPAVLAEYPSGTFLENLTFQTGGTVTFTSYFARQLGQLGTSDHHDVFAELPIHRLCCTNRLMTKVPLYPDRLIRERP